MCIMCIYKYVYIYIHNIHTSYIHIYIYTWIYDAYGHMIQSALLHVYYMSTNDPHLSQDAVRPSRSITSVLASTEVTNKQTIYGNISRIID